MSLFSHTYRKALTPTSSQTYAGPHLSGALYVMIQRLPLGVVMGFILLLTSLSIFTVRLREVPPHPETRVDGKNDLPRLVQKLINCLSPSPPGAKSFTVEGGDVGVARHEYTVRRI